MKTSLMQRRSFLAAVAAGLAKFSTDVGVPVANAQTNQGSEPGPLEVIDFHNHYVGTAFNPIVGAAASAALKPYFDRVNQYLSDSGALLGSIEQAGIAARVVKHTARVHSKRR